MAEPVLMPQIGQDIPEGLIIEWRVKEGDSVKKGDIIVVVESEKAVFEVEAMTDGVILKILYQAEDYAPVLKPIAYIGQAGESVQETESQQRVSEDDMGNQEVIPASPVIEKQEIDFTPSSPSARRVARELGVNIEDCTGTGPNGRVVKADVIKFSEQNKVAPVPPAAQPAVFSAEDVEIPMSRMHQVMARRLSESKKTIPHFYLSIEVDVTAVMAWREARNAASENRLTLTDILIHATAKALRNHPRMNSHFVNDTLIQKGAVNIGLAVSGKDGLLVPVIPNTDQMDLETIGKTTKQMVLDARNSIMKPQEPGTFTISNLGMFDIQTFLPIINPPECAILGVGTAKDTMSVLPNGTFGVRKIMNLTLASDHRVVDGAIAAKFLQSIKNSLENE